MKNINDELNRRIIKLNETALRGKPRRIRDEARGAFNEMQDFEGWLSEQTTNHDASENTLPIQNVVGSASKSELIVKLIEKIHSESDNKETLEYHSKMACGYGMVTLDIKIE